MKSVHFDPISSCCVCHPLINHEQLPVPAQESSLVYMIHVLSGLQPQHSTIWNLLLQTYMDTITSVFFFFTSKAALGDPAWEPDNTFILLGNELIKKKSPLT